MSRLAWWDDIPREDAGVTTGGQRITCHPEDQPRT
jgi:hypothetical protein